MNDHLNNTHAKINKSIVCSKCQQNQQMMQKYSQLVDLLKHKIQQLTNKIQKQPKIDCNIAARQLPISCLSQTIETCKNEPQNMEKVALQKTVPTISITKIENNISAPNQKQSIKWQKSIEGLREQVLSTKSNLMHIRQCIYSLFQETTAWREIRKSATGTNVLMVLFNLFEYSEQQREEMCRTRKVRLRKMDLSKEESLTQRKENTFMTVKHICY